MANIRTPASKGAALNSTEAVNTWKRVNRSKTADHTLVYTDNRDTFDLGTGCTQITIPDSVSSLVALCETGDFEVTLNNISGSLITLTCANAADKINESTADYEIPDGQSVTIKANNASDGVNLISRALLGHSGAFVYRTTTQAIGTGAETAINFTAADYDTHDAHTGGDPTKITIPAGVVVASFSAQVVIAANSTGVRYITLQKNGSALSIPMTVRDNSPSGTFTTSLHFNTGPITVAAGEYYEVKVYQNSGGNLNVGTASGNTWFKAEFK